jgi:beta-lactamase class D
VNHEELAKALERKITELDDLMDQKPKGCVLPVTPRMGAGYFIQDLANAIRRQAPPDLSKIANATLGIDQKQEPKEVTP